MSYRIIPRAEWGAIHDRGAGPAPLPASEVWLHHSVTIAPDLVPPFDDDHAAVRTLERIGEQRFGRGISYTFAITPAGLIFEGHGVDRRGSHTYGRNSAGRAICFVGNYEANRPTDAMLDAAGWLLAHGFLRGWWKAAKLKGGHRDVRATSCPGRHAYAAMGRIDELAAAHARGAAGLPPAPTPTPPPTSSTEYRMDTLDLRNAHASPVRGRHVDNLQALLLPLLAFIGRADMIPGLVAANGAPDGIAGKGTAEALEVGQNALLYFGKNIGSTKADRIAGPSTWRALIEF